MALLATALLAACTAAPPPAPTPLRVLVYNIHAGTDAAGQGNLPRVAALVRETGADLVLLQEVDRGTRRSGGVDQLAELARATGLYGAFGRTLWYQGGAYGVALLSRTPILAHRVVSLPNDPPQARAGGSREPRGVLHAVVALPRGGRLHVLNTHIDASADDRFRRQEMAALTALADSLLREGVAVLVGGDMNSEPGSAVQRMAAHGRLHDAWGRCGRGAEHTFPAAAPAKRIDYLYLTGELRCTEARVLASDASDHRPLLVHVLP